MNLLLGVPLEPGIKFIHGWNNRCNAGSVLREEYGRFFVFLRFEVRNHCSWTSQVSYLEN